MELHVVSGPARAGTPIVFLHGLGASADTWANCITILGERHPVHAIDLPGHGRSPVPATSDAYSRDGALAAIDLVLDRLGARPVLVGHSLGGYLALAHAATRPDAACGLVVLNTGPGYRDPVRREEWNERSRRNAHRFGVEPQVAELNLQHDSVVMDRLADIVVPTLVLAGSADRPEYTASGEYLERKMPHARLVVVDGGEHSMQETHAAQISAAIADLVDSLPTA